MYYGDSNFYGDAEWYGALAVLLRRSVFTNMGADTRTLGDGIMLRVPLARIGEHGFNLEIQTSYDGSGYSGAELHFTAPDGTRTTKTATSDDPSAGAFYWQVEEDFFDTAGGWEVMLEIDMGASGTRKSDIYAFDIGASGE